MNKNKGKYMAYTGIDCFRFIAALLVIAIHTSPLETFNETGDFILTRIIARVAVPFFIMTSGFFLISHWTPNDDRLKNFVKKSCLIYFIAILIYIPVNIYNGYFKMNSLLPNIIKDIVFDGTLYHLWYLPAAIVGAVIAWYLVKSLDYGKAFAITLLLYIIGMFGDSYFGIAKNLAFLNGFYEIIFQVSDYTRNGIFFAPVFFVLGGFIADQRRHFSLKSSAVGLSVSFVLMLCEGLILHYFNLQRHDSMYIFLLPCMYFMFSLLLHFRGRRLVWLKDISLIAYIVHPMMIIVIRFAAKALKLQSLFVENSLIHFILVCLTSIIAGIAVTAVIYRLKQTMGEKSLQMPTGCDRAYIEIDLKNLEYNVKVLQREMPPQCRLMAVVKANAYGHGSFEIASHLNRIGVRAFATATLDEGIALRKQGIRGDILILGYTDVRCAYLLKKYNLTQTIIDYAYADSLNNRGISVKVHIKADTGMHRLGIPYGDISSIEDIFAMKNLDVCGIFTHLCCSESLKSDDVAFTNAQINAFYDMLNELENDGISIPKIHIQSSYGLLNYPELECDYVRAGVALYGVLSSPNGDTRLKLNLRPVLSLKSKVILIRSVRKGESVGYDRSFTARRDSRIAILPIGYGDGFPRNLSGIGHVIINSNRFPIIGRICMDSLAVDITDDEDIVIGDMAILISSNNELSNTAPLVADDSCSISNELLCRLGERLPVITKYGR